MPLEMEDVNVDRAFADFLNPYDIRGVTDEEAFLCVPCGFCILIISNGK